MKNYYNDPFYIESSYALRSSEESGDYDFPALPAGGGNTAPSMPNSALPGLGGGPMPSGGGGQGFQNVLDKAPEYLNLFGSVVGMVKNVRDQRGQVGTNEIKAACGKKPLINKAKKQAYAQCVQRVLYPPIETQRTKEPDGMSTTTKVIIGVVVLVFLTVITIVIVKVAKSKKS